jgi:hypothetical protein
VLAAWTSAWVAGHVGPDEVIDAVTGADAPHQVAGLGGTDPQLIPLREVLLVWRRASAPVRVVLPVAGDLRGVPGPAGFRSAALEAGEAVCGGAVGIVPEDIDYAPSSAPPTVLWQAFAIEAAPSDYQQLSDAQYDLTTTLSACATALSALQAPGWKPDVTDALADARRAGEHLELPPGFPPRAVALLAQAERLQSVLDITAEDPGGGAIDRSGILARREAMRPLETAVRRARVAGYNATAC